MFIEWLTHDAKGTQNDITELAKLLFHRFHHCTLKVKNFVYLKRYEPFTISYLILKNYFDLDK